MKKTIRLTESELISLINGVLSEQTLNEQVIKGGPTDPYEYFKKGNKYYARKKGSSKWIKTSGKTAEAIAKKIFKSKIKTDIKKPINKNTMDVLVSDTLVNKKILFDPKRETTPFKCSEEGCAQWVSNQLDDLGLQRQGNAWHSHNIGQSTLKFTPFMDMGPNTQARAAKIFSNINSNPKEKTDEGEVKSFVKTLIPNQSALRKTLKVNDVVGLYFDDSTNFTKAFFEGATGVSDMGTGAKVTDGPYFIKKDGKPWTPNDLGKNIEFLPGNSLKNGSGFGMNTHLGYVGAIANGEPIIFHNVHGTVYATPLSEMGDTKIFWVKQGPKGNVVKPQETSPSWWESFTNLF
jgi:hypothetical protein